MSLFTISSSYSHFTESTNTKVATVSPTKKVPAISKNLKGLLTTNTRRIGRKYEIDLIKGPHGLGFSITTRDNPAGGKCPIYIKNINAMVRDYFSAKTSKQNHFVFQRYKCFRFFVLNTIHKYLCFNLFRLLSPILFLFL